MSCEGTADSPMIIDSNESNSSDSDGDDWSPPGSPPGGGRPPSPPGAEQDEDLSNSNIQNAAQDWLEMQEGAVVNDEKAALLEEFARKRRARQMHVPTEDKEVGSLLRSHAAPFCLFGEGPAERRDRLKDLLSRLAPEDQEQLQQQYLQDKTDTTGSARQAEETWYHPGPPRLKDVRNFILQYSIPRARDRIAKERRETADLTVVAANRQESAARLRRYQLQTSQNADTRPISCVRFSPDGSKLASASWSGNVQVWKVDNEEDSSGSHLLRGHEGHVDSVAWHPQATLSQGSALLNLASSGRDGNVFLWGLDSDTPLAHLQNLGERVTDLAFHPSGRLLALTVDDASWRLMDVEQEEEVLFQEGHSKSVSCISMQKDGSLAATGSMDAFGRVWDLRTGRCVMFMAGHQSPILSIDWSPDCYHLATGSQDNTVRVWDVRQRQTVITLPAHTGLVSGVKYDPNSGNFLATCSYDGTVKLWPHLSCQLLRSLEGHGHKVMSVDIAPNGATIATGAFDKTYKIWGPD